MQISNFLVSYLVDLGPTGPNLQENFGAHLSGRPQDPSKFQLFLFVYITKNDVILIGQGELEVVGCILQRGAQLTRGTQLSFLLFLLKKLQIL